MIIKTDTISQCLRRSNKKIMVIRKEMRHFITYLKNGWDTNLNYLLLFFVYNIRKKQ